MDLSHNSIGGHEEIYCYGSLDEAITKFVYEPEGVMAIADALRVNGGLTSLDVQYNNLDNSEGKPAIRKAVEGREGVDLKM